MTHTFKELTKFFQTPLDIVAQKLNYSEDNILILQNNKYELMEKFPNTYENIVSCKHNRDNRSPMEYARDLVSSWLFEDFMVEKFKELGYDLNLSGKDKERKILNNTKVGSDCDLVFVYNNEKYNIEIINDYSNYWNKYKKVDLRDDKYHKLLACNSILLATSIFNRTYALIQVTKDLNVIYIDQHIPYGNKPAYQIDISNIDFKNFIVKNIIDDLIKIIKK